MRPFSQFAHHSLLLDSLNPSLLIIKPLFFPLSPIGFYNDFPSGRSLIFLFPIFPESRFPSDGDVPEPSKWAFTLEKNVSALDFCQPLAFIENCIRAVFLGAGSSNLGSPDGLLREREMPDSSE